MLIYVLGVLEKKENEDTLPDPAGHSDGVCFSRPQLQDLSPAPSTPDSAEGLKSDLWLNALLETIDTFRVRGV
jgi:hypothetical protein